MASYAIAASLNGNSIAVTVNPTSVLDDAYYTANQITVGESSMPRDEAISAVGMTSQQFRLKFFTARSSFTATQIRAYTSSTAAAATPSLCRMGLYSVAANGNGTLIASCANDTSLFATINTVYTRAFVSPASVALVRGQRYAVGLIVVSATTVPTVAGISATNAAMYAEAPRLIGTIGSQSDLPNSFTDAGLTASSVAPYMEVLP